MTASHRSSGSWWEPTGPDPRSKMASSTPPMNRGMGEVLTWRHASQASGWSLRKAPRRAGRAPCKRKSSAVSNTLFNHRSTLFATIHKPQRSRSAIQ